MSVRRPFHVVPALTCVLAATLWVIHPLYRTWPDGFRLATQADVNQYWSQLPKAWTSSEAPASLQTCRLSDGFVQVRQGVAHRGHLHTATSQLVAAAPKVFALDLVPLPALPCTALPARPVTSQRSSSTTVPPKVGPISDLPVPVPEWSCFLAKTTNTGWRGGQHALHHAGRCTNATVLQSDSPASASAVRRWRFSQRLPGGCP